MVTRGERRLLDAAEAASSAAPLLGPFYHLVHTDSPTDADFLSQWARNLQASQAGQRGRAIPERGDTLHMWAGISAFDDEAAARRTAAQYPNLGRFTARLQVPARSLIRIEKTGTDAS